VYFGPVTNPKNEKLHDLTPREVVTFVPLIILAFWIGLFPKPFFQILETPVNNIVYNQLHRDLPKPQPEAPLEASAPHVEHAAAAEPAKAAAKAEQAKVVVTPSAAGSRK
jgi:NADH-quinone oxidoreductase subunit M